MNNKTLSGLVLGSVGVALLAAFLETEAPGLSEVMYMISGLGLLIFGSWSAFILRKVEDK